MSAPKTAAKSTPRVRSKWPLIIVIAMAATSGFIVIHDAFEHRVTVTAMDGSRHEIELDPDIIRANRPAAGLRGPGETPAVPILPGNEVNLTGTAGR